MAPRNDNTMDCKRGVTAKQFAGYSLLQYTVSFLSHFKTQNILCFNNYNFWQVPPSPCTINSRLLPLWPYSCCLLNFKHLIAGILQKLES